MLHRYFYRRRLRPLINVSTFMQHDYSFSLYVVVLFSMATCSLEELVKSINDELRRIYSRASFTDDNFDSIDIMRSENHSSKKNVKTQLLRSVLFSELWIKSNKLSAVVNCYSENLANPLFCSACRSRWLDDYLRMIKSSVFRLRTTEEEEEGEAEKERARTRKRNKSRIFQMLSLLFCLLW